MAFETITRRQMAEKLRLLFQNGSITPNEWCGEIGPDEDMADAWSRVCSGITLVSVLAPWPDGREARCSSSNPGDIRFDQPGTLHPMTRAELMFVPDGLGEDTLEWLADKTTALFIVQDTPPTD